MMNLPLSQELKITLISGVVASGTTAVTPTKVDMQGWAGVMFLASFGSSAADIGMKVQQAKQSDLSDVADLAGSLKLLDGTKKQIVIDVRDPQERYVRPNIQRTTATTVEAVWAMQYRPRSVPVDNNTAAQAALLLESPVEGTA